VTADAVTEEWRSPDGGDWWFEAAHFPRPVSLLFAVVLDQLAQGRVRGAGRWGLRRQGVRWQRINGYLYIGVRGEGAAGDEALAAQAVAERRWRREAEQWFADERPAAVARNQALQAVAVESLDDDELRAHAREVLDHVLAVGPLHFEHRGREVVLDLVRERAKAEGIDEAVVMDAMAGGSPASSRPAELARAIAEALRAGAIDPASVRTFDDVRAAPEAGRCLDAYLTEYGHRLVDSYDLLRPTLRERPELVLGTIRAAARDRATTPRPPPPALSAELADLVADARTSYGIEDDDDGVCVFWPLGLLRRALLEVGRRAGLEDPSDVFETDIDELRALLDGAGPASRVLAARRAEREAARHRVPPASIGAEAPWAPPASDAGDGQLKGQGVGAHVARGPACVVRDENDGLDRLQPGDVLVAVTTTPGYNTVLPIVVAVATETVMGHTIICARELGIPAVVGVPGLLDAVADGDVVEVDPVAGVVRIVA
jgi:pyruvate,water dikinase